MKIETNIPAISVETNGERVRVVILRIPTVIDLTESEAEALSDLLANRHGIVLDR